MNYILKCQDDDGDRSGMRKGKRICLVQVTDVGKWQEFRGAKEMEEVHRTPSGACFFGLENLAEVFFW